jgi:hypothetical protein
MEKINFLSILVFKRTIKYHKKGFEILGVSDEASRCLKKECQCKSVRANKWENVIQSIFLF